MELASAVQHHQPPQSPLTRFAEFYEAQFAFVWRAARRLGVPEAALEDVAQDVFVTVYRKLDELDTDVSPRGWLYGVTRRVAFRYRRTSARRDRKLAALSDIVPSSDPDEPLRVREAVRVVDAFLAELDEDKRQTFLLSEILGMTGPEVAAAMSTELNTVYSRLRLARNRFKSFLHELDVADAKAHTVVDHARRSDDPPREASQRAWAAIIVQIGGGATAAVTASGGAFSVLKLIGLLAAAGLAVAAAIAFASGPEPATAQHGITTAAPRAPASRAQPEPASHPQPEPPARTPSVVAAKTAEPEPARPQPKRETSKPKPAAGPTRAEGIDAELELIDAAQAALVRGDANTALAQLQEHAKRFPNGKLLDLRRAARVRALCKLGRREQARKEAADFLASSPSSTLAQRMKTACPEPAP